MISVKMELSLNLRKLLLINGKRYMSTTTITNESVRKMRNDLFTAEKRRQQSHITRVEKIEVQYEGVPNSSTLIMNKNMSTPYNCAQHVHEVLCQRSVLAEVNGELWDIHRPLIDNCTLKLLNFHTAPTKLNKVFWRSCSFLLGLVIERAFKDEHFIHLHSWPRPKIASGSYVYDADTSIPNWKPTKEEMKTFTTMMCKLSHENCEFERLEVTENMALEMFQHNRFKSEQIPQLASSGRVTLYRVKDHVDISCGPMMASTKFVGTTQVVSVHPLSNECGYRFQAVSIPKQLTLNSFAFSLLVDRAKKLNETGLIADVEETNQKSSALG